VLRQLRDYGEGLREGAAAGTEAEARRVFERYRLVPVRTGALKASGYITPVEVQGEIATVEVGYSAPYAAAVHEDLEAQHPTGQAKFLEQPVNEAIPELPERIGRAAVEAGKRRAGI
jgi:hypothetical protein